MEAEQTKTSKTELIPESYEPYVMRHKCVVCGGVAVNTDGWLTGMLLDNSIQLSPFQNTDYSGVFHICCTACVQKLVAKWVDWVKVVG